MRVKIAALLSDARVCFPPPNHPAELILPMLADAEGDKIQNRKKSERKFRKFRISAGSKASGEKAAFRVRLQRLLYIRSLLFHFSSFNQMGKWLSFRKVAGNQERIGPISC